MVGVGMGIAMSALIRGVAYIESPQHCHWSTVPTGLPVWLGIALLVGLTYVFLFELEPQQGCLTQDTELEE